MTLTAFPTTDVRRRTLHLVDLENLIGDPEADAAVVRAVMAEYLAVSGWRVGDLVTVAVNPGLARRVYWDLDFGCNAHTVAGANGADLALLTHAAPEFIERRAGRLVIGSGDHIFVRRELAVRDRGVGVLVVARPGSVSSGRRAHGFPVVHVDAGSTTMAA
jgi:hypothetical protein